MSNLVEQIRGAVATVVTNTLSADYNELPFQFDVEVNDNRRLAKAWGLIPLAGPGNEETPLRTYTIDQVFELILTDTNPRKTDDSDKFTAVYNLYDQIDSVLKALLLTRAGLPTIILNIDLPSYSEPEFLSEDNFIVLRCQFVVKYRSDIS